MAWRRAAAERKLHSALGMLAGLDLQPPESPDAPEEQPWCASASANTTNRLITPRGTEPLTLEQLQTEAASLSAGLVPVTSPKQSGPKGAMQALLDRHPLAPARARAQALQAWAALEDGSSCAGSEATGSCCSSSAGWPDSAAASSSCSTNQFSAGRPPAAGRGSCGSACRSLRAGQRRCTWAGAVIPAAGPAGGSMKGRRAEPSLCTRTQHVNQAEASCCMDAQKSSCNRPAAGVQATAYTAGGPSIAWGAEGPPKQAWSAEEDAWVAHAQWMAAQADSADGRRAARHLLAQLLPHRGSVELLVRWRWCAHGACLHEAQYLGSECPNWVSASQSCYGPCKRCTFPHALSHIPEGNANYSAQGPYTNAHRQARGAGAVAEALHCGE